MASQKPYAVNVRMDIQPERREEFVKIIKEDQKLTLSDEEGSLQFVIGEDIETPNRFYLHEQYVSEEAFQVHTKAPYFKTWTDFCASMPWSPDGAPVVNFYSCTHDAQEIPVRTAFCLNVELCIKPEVREEFIEVISNNQKGTVEDEPLALQYHWGESTSTPNSFHFHEQYKGEEQGKEGFEAHKQAPHFAAWEKFVGKADPFTKPPSVSLFRTLQ